MFKEIDYVRSIVEMASYSNQKFSHYQKIWVEYDNIAFVIAIFVGMWSICFHIVTNFGPKDAKTKTILEQNQGKQLSGAAGVIGVYFLNILGFFNIYFAALLISGISMILTRP